MMFRTKKKFITLTLAVALSLSGFNAVAQTAFNDFSPYSLFALGHMENIGDQNTIAMGGIGVGNRDNTIINLVNPAAVTARDEKAFMLDFGVQQKNVIYKEGDRRSANNMFNIHHIAASFPITNKMAFKVGLMPYSAVGYNFSAYEEDDNHVANIGTIQYIKSGQGSLYQVFLSPGVTLFDRLSVGVDGIFYMGTIGRYSATSFSSNLYYRTLSRNWTFMARGFSAKFGVQYEQPIGESLTATIGATYKLGSTLRGERAELSVANSSSYTDTVSVVDNSSFAGYELPSEIAIGFTVRKFESWMFGFDYTRQDWSRSKFDATPNIDFKTGVSESFKAGFEWIPNKYDVRYYFPRVTYRVGFYHNKTYMFLNGQQLKNTGITFGLSFPVYNKATAIALSVDLGQMGTQADNLIRERYIKFNVGLNLYDLWFFKSVYN